LRMNFLGNPEGKGTQEDRPTYVSEKNTMDEPDVKQGIRPQTANSPQEEDVPLTRNREGEKDHLGEEGPRGKRKTELRNFTTTRTTGRWVGKGGPRVERLAWSRWVDQPIYYGGMPRMGFPPSNQNGAGKEICRRKKRERIL